MLGRLLLIILVSLFSKVSWSSADSSTGYDLLALQHPSFPIQKILAEIPKGSSLGVLLDTFGSDRFKIIKALESEKFTSFRIHLANGAGLRNGQLGSYENLTGLNIKSFEGKVLKKDPVLLYTFIERAKFIKELVEKFPSIKCFVSPVLEHNLSPEAFLIIAEVVQSAAPRCAIVNNPVNGWKYELATGHILEVHGLQSSPVIPYLASQDGDFGSKEEFLRLHQSAKLKFIWKRSFNCRTPGKFVDPRKRELCN